MGSKRYPTVTELFITADAGGSNGYRARLWKFELQRLADKLGIPIHVSHFPPGTSKWNRVEHRLFSFVTMNWRGKPLRTYETVVSLIGNATNIGIERKSDRVLDSGRLCIGSLRRRRPPRSSLPTTLRPTACARPSKPSGSAAAGQ